MSGERASPPLPDWAGEAARRYEAGETLRSIARRYRVGQARAAEVVRGAGATVRPNGPPPVGCPSPAAYKRGCKCAGCRAAAAQAARQWYVSPSAPPRPQPAARMRAAPARPRSRRPLPPWADAAAEAYEAGASLRELAARHGTGPGAVRRLLVRLGTDIRPAHSTRLPRGQAPAWAAGAAARYEAGDSLDSLASRYGVLPRTVRRVLTGRGVVIRPAGRQARK